MQIIGHRGARGLWPENTLEGFQRAMLHGVTAFELDVVFTKDKQVVVTHDPTLNPDITRAGTRFIDEGVEGIKLSERDTSYLRIFDVGMIRPGSAYAKRFPHQQPIDGQMIPSLRDVLTRVCNRAAVTIEIKSFPEDPSQTVPIEFIETIRDVIDEVTCPWDDITISSFDWFALQLVEKIIPWIPRAYLTEDADDTTIINTVKEGGCKIWSPEYQDLDASLVERAHAAGLKVVTWTVNDPTDIQLCEKIGVDGVITDYPCKIDDLT